MLFLLLIMLFYLLCLIVKEGFIQYEKIARKINLIIFSALVECQFFSN